jgi:hypothetical protein
MMLVGTTSGLWHGDRRIDAVPVYGVSWDRAHVYLGERGSGGRLVRSSPSLERLETIRPLVRDIHQVLWADGALYFTNTFEDLLEAWDGTFSVPYRASDEGQDTRHLNSVWLDGDGGLWVVEHGRGQGPACVRCATTGWARELDGEVGAHNVYVEGGRAYVLAGRFALAVDLRSKAVERLADVPDSYLRGLARGDGFWYVGRSLVSSERDERKGKDAHVLVFDDGWREVGRVTLPRAGQVHEVRLLAGDAAHNGLPYPGELP